MDCKFLKAIQADCDLAKHKVKFTESANNLFDWVVHFAFGLSGLLYVLSLIFFVGTPFMRTTIRAKEKR